MTKEVNFGGNNQSQMKQPSAEEIAAYNDYVGNMILDAAKNQVIIDYIIEQIGQEEFEKRLDTTFKAILEDYQTQRNQQAKEFFKEDSTEEKPKITLK